MEYENGTQLKSLIVVGGLSWRPAEQQLSIINQGVFYSLYKSTSQGVFGQGVILLLALANELPLHCFGQGLEFHYLLWLNKHTRLQSSMNVGQ